jgi:sulfide:quinone oxidoreductase
MTMRVLILGAGFGGLELSTSLSEALGDTAAITLIDKSDAFVFGYSPAKEQFGSSRRSRWFGR